MNHSVSHTHTQYLGNGPGDCLPHRATKAPCHLQTRHSHLDGDENDDHPFQPQSVFLAQVVPHQVRQLSAVLQLLVHHLQRYSTAHHGRSGVLGEPASGSGCTPLCLLQVGHMTQDCFTGSFPQNCPELRLRSVRKPERALLTNHLNKITLRVRICS